MGENQRSKSQAILDQLFWQGSDEVFWQGSEEASRRPLLPAAADAPLENSAVLLEQTGPPPANLEQLLDADNRIQPGETAGQESSWINSSAVTNRHEPNANPRESDSIDSFLEETASKSERNAAAQPILVEKAETSYAQFRAEPKLLDDICILEEAGRLELPHIARILVSTLLQTKEAAPICILLPSTEYVAQFTAILASLECLASDFKSTREEFVDRFLTPGTKVRALPEGNVFVVGDRCVMSGIDGIFLHYTDKQTSSTHGRHLFPVDKLYRFEPTTRKLPISRSSIKLSTPRPSRVDELAGTGAFGNSMLYRTRVVLVGARTQFERALDLALLVGKNKQEPNLSSLSAAFAWGTFDAAGKPIVLSPGGSAGHPLVAISRDFIDLEKASLGRDVEPGSQVVITDRLDLVLKSMDLANQVGARQRLLLLAEARKRTDIDPLLQHGWKVWEPLA